MRQIVAVVVILGFCFFASLAAGPVDPNFVAVNSACTGAPNDCERLELRGNGNNTSWSFGLGLDTQQAGAFDQSGFDWDGGITYDFTYSMDSFGNAVFQLFTRKGELLGGVSFKGMQLGNTLEIHAKRDVRLSVNGQQITGDAGNAFGVDFLYIPIDPVNGFSISGSIQYFDPIKNQAFSGVTMTVGNRASVPEPGSLILVAMGLGFIAAYLRKRCA